MPTTSTILICSATDRGVGMNRRDLRRLAISRACHVCPYSERTVPKGIVMADGGRRIL